MSIIYNVQLHVHTYLIHIISYMYICITIAGGYALQPYWLMAPINHHAGLDSDSFSVVGLRFTWGKIFWLVVDLPLWKIWRIVSWDYDIPNCSWKVIKTMFQSPPTSANYRWLLWSFMKLKIIQSCLKPPTSMQIFGWACDDTKW